MPPLVLSAGGALALFSLTLRIVGRLLTIQPFKRLLSVSVTTRAHHDTSSFSTLVVTPAYEGAAQSGTSDSLARPDLKRLALRRTFFFLRLLS